MSEIPSILVPNPAADLQPAHCNFADVARLEFQACLQLLAERACFLTAAEGCAIALKEEDGALRFCAVAGNSEHEPGSDVPAEYKGGAQCLAALKPVIIQDSSIEHSWSRTFIPILRDNDKAAGFVELITHFPLELSDNEELIRIASLISVAQDLCDAALTAGDRIAENGKTVSLPPGMLWHAPEKYPSEKKSEAASTTPSAATAIRTCTSCGFPVSHGRSLCVDCEQNPHASSAASTQMFASEARQSWVSAHGYTLASILVTVITVVLILWLRR